MSKGEAIARPDLHLVEPASDPDAAPHSAAGVNPAQAEMPFAIVDGEAITELPQDLYIPPQALEVFLEAFEGPLDLLLYLIRRQNLDILNIPIAEITRQYVEYIELMDELQLDLVGEYLLMAAMLAEIKLGLPVYGGGGREDEVLYVVSDHLIQQGNRFGNVILVILQRPLNRLAHQRKGGKVHYRIERIETS